ncbi:PucR family transcriptional regulator [Actinomycetospora chibensis]|uniref:PucR family transcriptional regulator n=1 Tax=Actinomycetospora chibensis TaxID=663606 RepID=A0ABV9RR08_9PSEU|nr:helix-turn-helix domain-containing protein [Actinomycetospora chibensis]MDD7923200.1 helix-turn-helix domain-containing protein [Actinomycetospora chibensis]
MTSAAVPGLPGRAAGGRSPVRATTLRRLERSSGEVANAGVAAMAARLPWFTRLTAEQRSGVLLVTQTGTANFVAWLRDPDATPRLTAEAFRSAPLDLARRVTLRQTVELVRIAIAVFEERIPRLGVDEAEQAALEHAVLRFGREVAFSAATVYASAAEARGAWDARLEALVVDAVVRGEAAETLLSRASALGWDPATETTALVGEPPAEEPPEPLHAVRRAAHRAGATVLLGTHGAKLVMIAGPGAPLDELSASFGPGAVVAGPTVAGLTEAHLSATRALAGHRAVRAWPGAPRPVAADDLLPERVLDGDAGAVEQLRREVAAPLREAGGELAATVECYLDVSGVLEAAARALYVHPNTVRYRLRRVSEVTGRHPGEARGALVLRLALVLDRLHSGASPG